MMTNLWPLGNNAELQFKKQLEEQAAAQANAEIEAQHEAQENQQIDTLIRQILTNEARSRLTRILADRCYKSPVNQEIAYLTTPKW